MSTPFLWRWHRRVPLLSSLIFDRRQILQWPFAHAQDLPNRFTRRGLVLDHRVAAIVGRDLQLYHAFADLQLRHQELTPMAESKQGSHHGSPDKQTKVDPPQRHH